MNLLVVGGSGLVGWNVVRGALDAGLDVSYTVYSNQIGGQEATEYELDIRDERRTHRTIVAANPDVVVHAAGLTDADACEQDPRKSEAINVEGTKHVASACESVGATLLYFSSSMVFDGRQEWYDEDSDRNPISTYGDHKTAAEDIVNASAVDSVVMRIDQPYCWPTEWQQDTFVSWTYDRLERGDPFPVFVDWCNTPVFMDDLTNAVTTVIRGNYTGTYHVVGSEYVSRYVWARVIATAFDRDPDLIRKGHSDDIGLPATRPSAHLSNRRIREETGVTFRTVEEGAETLAERQRRDAFRDGRYRI